jgi:hypothetical protein
LQHPLNGASDFIGMAGLIQPWLAALLQKRRALISQDIPREKNHALAQVGMLMHRYFEEGWPINLRHPQITQDHIITMLLKLG